MSVLKSSAAVGAAAATASSGRPVAGTARTLVSVLSDTLLQEELGGLDAALGPGDGDYTFV